MLNTGAGRVDPLILTVFDGPSGSARVYEDAGNSLGYQKNECAWTGVSYHRDEQGVATLKISPTKGRYPGITSGRAYAVRIAGVWPPAKIICNGKAIPRAAGVGRTGWRYRGSTSTLEVSLPSFRRSETVTVKILPRAAEPPRSLLDGVPGTLRRLKNVMALINSQWPAEWSPDSLVAAAQTGNRMELEPAQAQEEVRKLQLLLPAVERALPVLEIPDSVRTRAQGHLSTITGVRGDR